MEPCTKKSNYIHKVNRFIICALARRHKFMLFNYVILFSALFSALSKL